MCPGSGAIQDVSPYDACFRVSACPICQQKIRIVIPHRKNYSTIARFTNHPLKGETLNH